MPDATPRTTPATPAAPSAAPAAAPEASARPKVKVRKHRQRSCDEKDEKGKLCCGHLKRYYDYPKEIEDLVGKSAEIYRCEFCQTIYKPNPGDMPNSFTLRV